MTTAAISMGVTGRIVYTFWSDPTRWYDGVLTGYLDGDRCVLEHVIALRPGCVIPMLRAGIAYAFEELGAAVIVFGIPDGYPKARGLAAAARRVGCAVYEHQDGITYFVRYP